MKTTKNHNTSNIILLEATKLFCSYRVLETGSCCNFGFNDNLALQIIMKRLCSSPQLLQSFLVFLSSLFWISSLQFYILISSHCSDDVWCECLHQAAVGHRKALKTHFTTFWAPNSRRTVSVRDELMEVVKHLADRYSPQELEVEIKNRATKKVNISLKLIRWPQTRDQMNADVVSHLLKVKISNCYNFTISRLKRATDLNTSLRLFDGLLLLNGWTLDDM